MFPLRRKRNTFWEIRPLITKLLIWLKKPCFLLLKKNVLTIIWKYVRNSGEQRNSNLLSLGYPTAVATHICIMQASNESERRGQNQSKEK